MNEKLKLDKKKLQRTHLKPAMTRLPPPRATRRRPDPRPPLQPPRPPPQPPALTANQPQRLCTVQRGRGRVFQIESGTEMGGFAIPEKKPAYFDRL